MKNIFGSPTTETQLGVETAVPHDATPEITELKNDIENTAVKAGDEAPDSQDQLGVQKAEAVTILWTKKQLLVAYGFAFLVFFVVSMEQQIQNNLSYYVYSSFQLSPAYGVGTIVGAITTGVFRLPLAKIIDLTGRAEGLALMTCIATIGLIMMASCKTATVYAAAYSFYWVGFDGITYVLTIFIADTSSLKNRAWMEAWTTTPYIVTTFIGSRAAASFLETSGWRWGYGSFCIITPVIAAPIVFIILRNQRFAMKSGMIYKPDSGRSVLESIAFYFWEFDVVGLLLITAGISLILLPFSLASYQTKGWGSGMIIAMLVIGFLCLCAFPIWEKYVSKRCFIPFYLLKDRTILGACFLAMLIDISFYMWDTYFYYFLQVVYGLSIVNTGYMTNIFSIGSCFWAIPVGFAIKKSGYFKWIAFFSLGLEMLGAGLMIYFRSHDQGIGYQVMCQIFIAFGGGALVVCNQLAVMAAVSHANVAGIVAFLGLFSSVGSSIGLAVSEVIYQNTFYDALLGALPSHNETLAAELYASTTTQLLYPMGSDERTATIYAYEYTQKKLCIAALCWLIPGMFLISMWKNFRVSEMRQVKGLVA
ncbi:hypothetical protein BP6252_09633 [Coleophoma cylindrospora]|uniref:Major facilitator superfamily (MFS) profile domain-containing protein n=1 Tax=Coleophoma cylindrospora TaxID=1849047 RepID=A0A3D8QWC8_9HELO|nr:hypothetical protein BP6252_09633 [Coleophoma cylindrospora]